MEKVRDPAGYRDLLDQNKKRFGRLETNSIVMPGTLDQVIREGRLFYEQYARGIAFFRDEGRYYVLSYHLEPGAPLEDLRRDRPVVAEEPGDRRKESGRFGGIAPALLNAGFRLFKTNLQVERDLKALPGGLLEEQCRAGIKALKEQSLRACYDGGSEYAAGARALWEKYLDATDVPEDHFRQQPGDTLLCVVDGGNAVAAVNWWRTSGRTSEGRHTVTSPAYCRKGIASAMLAIWCGQAKRAGAYRAFTWISDTNQRSLALYEKSGFSVNGRTSKQYILK